MTIKRVNGGFCIAYKFILEDHTLHATAGTGAMISDTLALALIVLSMDILEKSRWPQELHIMKWIL